MMADWLRGFICNVSVGTWMLIRVTAEIRRQRRLIDARALADIEVRVWVGGAPWIDLTFTVRG